MPGFLYRCRVVARMITCHLDRLARWLRFNWMYFGNPPWDSGTTPPELADYIAHHPPGRAIDLGCGTGTNLLALARAGWQVTGVEFVPRAANQARRKLRQAGLAGEVRTGDVTRKQIVQGAYDLALDIGCYHGLPYTGRALYRANLADLLLPVGHFLIYAHWQPDGQAGRTCINQEDISSFLDIFFLERRLDSQDRWGRQATWMLFRKR